MFSNYIKYGFRYSLRYILKYIIRVVIFFSIIYLISFLSGKHLFISDVHAESISSVSTPGLSQQVSNTSTSIQYDIGRGNWANWGSGYFYYSFSLVKKSDVATDYVVFPSFATAYSGGHEFICEIGSVSVNNSTRNGQTYSAKCPMTSYGDGVVRLRVRLFDYGVHPNNPIYEIHINGLITFEKASSSQVNVDMSSVTQQQQQTNQYLKDQITDIQNNTKTIEKSNKKLEDINNKLTDDNVDSSTNKGSSFFNNFDSGDEGSLTDIVSLPLDFVQHLNDTCQPFTIPTGKLGNITIPCLSSIWSGTSFAGIINTASLIINGIICYKLLTSLFLFFKELKDPDDDKVEVMNL